MHSETNTNDRRMINRTTITYQGVVTKKLRERFTVNTGSRLVECTLAAHLLKTYTEGKLARAAKRGKTTHSEHPNQGSKHDPVAVGDHVCLTIGEDGAGRIEEILPRRSQLSRASAVPMPGAMPFEQVIAANVSQAVPVFAAAQPAPKWNMLDRYLVAAEALGLPSLICITKLDLVQNADGRLDQEVYEVTEDYRRIGYPVILVSAVTGAGLNELHQALSGQTSVMLGKSGVGKTSLLNALQPGLGLRVNTISQATGKGLHTTTHLEMFPLDSHSAIIDTPGVREFGLWAIEPDDLPACFPEMRPFLGRCKFGLDCRHDEEPGCAVRIAVMTGEVSPRRYASFMRLQEDLER